MAIPFDIATSGLSNFHESSRTIRVEFYGVPRARAGCGQVELPRGSHLGELLRELARRFPQLEGDCLRDGRPTESCIINLDGRRFVRDPATGLDGVHTVLVLSADSGG